VTPPQAAVVQALRNDLHLEEDVLRFARERLGYKRLGSSIRAGLISAAWSLNHMGLLVIEDGEYFLTALGREAELRVNPLVRTASPPVRYQARSTYRRPGRRRRRY
jgi:hypothetical protein